MGGKAAEMGAEEPWSDDLSEEELEEFELFDEMDDEMGDEFEAFNEPTPNTREQFEEWEEPSEDEVLWDEEA